VYVINFACDSFLYHQEYAGSKDRLHRAKTIDLCQNPLTVSHPKMTSGVHLTHAWYAQKEPKLSRARQIPEWEEYDNEIAQFARRLAAEGKIHASVATAGSDVLANVGLAQQAKSNDVGGASESDGGDDSHPHDEL